MSGAMEETESLGQGTLPISDFPSIASLEQTVEFPAISIPSKETAKLRKQLKAVLLHQPRMKTIFPDPNDADRRILLLNDQPSIDGEGFSRYVVYSSEPLKSIIEDASMGCRKEFQNILVKYEDLSLEAVLRKVLPVNIKEIPSAFETIGKLIHVNLREEALPYKYWIGKVLLDKYQPRIHSVVNKIGTIESEYRTFKMEVIAGDSSHGWSEVTVREEGCVFELDFQHVYWNSRLGGEHRRLVNVIQREAASSKRKITTVVDLMAGIGPFAVPLTACKVAGKGGKNHSSLPSIRVFANDLNPTSFKYLQINQKRNNCRNLQNFNEDARAFLLLMQEEEKKSSKVPHVDEIDHVIMNLPASAPEFLNAFRGWKLTKLPRIHVHCFCTKDDSANNHVDSIKRCENSLGCKLEATEVHIVRDISPAKNMICVSFNLPPLAKTLHQIEHPKRTHETNEKEGQSKKARYE